MPQTVKRSARKTASHCRRMRKTHTFCRESGHGFNFACLIKVSRIATMSINSINTSIQNQFSQISAPTANKTADAEASMASTKSSSAAAASDTVTISEAGQAMASAATSFVQALDAGRALTAEDKALIGYPNPSDPNVTFMAATISDLRERGYIEGKITSEYFKGDDGSKMSLFDVFPKDEQSQNALMPLKQRMGAAFAKYKHNSEEVTKLENDKLLMDIGRLTTHSTNAKVKAMLRHYHS
jgi:hypothetical protein